MEASCQEVWARGQDSHVIPEDGGLKAGAGGGCCSELRAPPAKQGRPSLFTLCDKPVRLQRPDLEAGSVLPLRWSLHSQDSPAHPVQSGRHVFSCHGRVSNSGLLGRGRTWQKSSQSFPRCHSRGYSVIGTPLGTSGQSCSGQNAGDTPVDDRAVVRHWVSHLDGPGSRLRPSQPPCLLGNSMTPSLQ